MKAKVIMLETTNRDPKIGLTLTNQNKLLEYGNPIGKSESRINIYLIDETAEIKKGDFVYCELNTSCIRRVYKSGKYLCYGMAGNNFIIDKATTHKVIATTDKSLKYKEFTGVVDESNGVKEVLEYPIPQLSEQSIKLLIDYYNEHGKMPDEAEIEIQRNFKYNPDIYGTSVYSRYKTPNGEPNEELEPTIKLNLQGTVDITLPEEKLYTKAKVCELLNKYRQYTWRVGSGAIDLNDWIAENL